MDSSRIQEVLSARFLGVDFGPYFAFIKSLPQADGGHRHHILPRREFPEYAKDQDNLFRVSPANHFKAHYWLALCAPQIESFQFVFYLMANRKRVYQIPTDKLTHYAEIYERGRMALVEKARILGLSGVGARVGARRRNELYGNPATPEGRAKAGRKNVESGQLRRVSTRRACIKGGQEAGLRNVESGHIQKLGKIQGRKNVENGHIGDLNRKNVESGQIQALGHIQGLINVANGTLEKGRHTRWHVNRNVVNSACRLCFLEEACPNLS